MVPRPPVTMTAEPALGGSHRLPLRPHHCPRALAWHREGLGLMGVCDPRDFCWRPSRGRPPEVERGPASGATAPSLSPENVY